MTFISLLNRFNRVFECGLNIHYDVVLLIMVNHRKRLNNLNQQPEQYKDHHDDNNISKLDEFFRNDLSVFIIGLIISISIFITEIYGACFHQYFSGNR